MVAGFSYFRHWSSSELLLMWMRIELLPDRADEPESAR
jgi:hypothetical protein